MGLYRKYKIEKSDGTPTDPQAQYFVLRIDSDMAAREALKAYAGFIRRYDPDFSAELLQWLRETPFKPKNK